MNRSPSYFNGITFLEHSRQRQCTTVVDHPVDFPVVLNYVWRGQIFWREPSGELITLETGTAYWTFDDLDTHYGSMEGRPWDQS